MGLKLRGPKLKPATVDPFVVAARRQDRRCQAKPKGTERDKPWGNTEDYWLLKSEVYYFFILQGRRDLHVWHEELSCARTGFIHSLRWGLLARWSALHRVANGNRQQMASTRASGLNGNYNSHIRVKGLCLRDMTSVAWNEGIGPLIRYAANSRPITPCNHTVNPPWSPQEPLSKLRAVHKTKIPSTKDHKL